MTTFIVLAGMLVLAPQISWVFLLTLASFKKKNQVNTESDNNTFHILVPAHNEEAVIQGCLDSLLKLEYPQKKFKITVIADNCDDRTAQISKSMGVDVWERSSDDRKSKGYALEDAFQKYSDEDQFHAYIIVDADTLVAPNLLKVFSGGLDQGHQWIQALYTGSNVNDSWRTKLMEWGFSLFNGSYMQAINNLDLSAPLRGNGMCFSKKGLKQIPWSCSGLAEDMEFGWEIRLAKQHVHFMREARVFGEFVKDSKDAKSQRQRWEKGRRDVQSKYLYRLRNLSLYKHILYILDLSMWPLSKTIAGMLGLSVLSLIVKADQWQVLIIGLGWLTLIVYTLLPILQSFCHPSVLKAAVHIPSYIVWKSLVFMQKQSSGWVRTKRVQEQSSAGDSSFLFEELNFANLDLNEAAEKITQLANEAKTSWVVTPNSDHVLRAKKDSKFKKIAQEADLLVADGMPIVWASRLLGQALKERVTGADLLPTICRLAASKGIEVCMLGGMEGEAMVAIKNFESEFPGFKGSYIYPPFGFEKDPDETSRIISRLHDSKARIIFVGVGSPKQEYWIYDHRDQLPEGVYLGVGMAISLAAGTKSRAPEWMQKNGLEWLYRIYQEPVRMIKRYSSNFEIFLLIVKAWIK